MLVITCVVPNTSSVELQYFYSTNGFDVVLTRELEVLAISKGAQKVSTLKRGAAKSFTLS